MSNKPTLGKWLFNPFDFLPGKTALQIGLLALTASGLLSWVAGMHQDGILNLHSGPTAPFWMHVMEAMVCWLIYSLICFLFSLIFSRTRVRIIDFLSTLSFAQWPFAIGVGTMILVPIQEVSETLLHSMQDGQNFVPDPSQTLILVLGSIPFLATVIWTIALLYNGYRISSNLKGTRLIASFIVSLVLTMVLTQQLVHWLLKVLI